MQAQSDIVDSLLAPYRHIATFAYDLPQGLVNVWVSCGADFQLAYDIETDPGANKLVYWWFTVGRHEFPGVGALIDRCLVSQLHSNHLPNEALLKLGDRQQPVAVDDCQHLPVTPLLSIVWSNRGDLRSLIDLGTPEGRARMWYWWMRNGSNELLDKCRAPIDAVSVVKPQDFEFQGERSAANISLVGYPGGEFGLGEDIRQLRASLHCVGIDPSVVVAPWTITARENVGVALIDSDVAVFEKDVIFYVMPPSDTLTLLNRVGLPAFKARRRIGFWQWELECFPKQALMALSLVDEIWCHSDHVAKGLRQVTDKPVYKVPLPVSAPTPKLVPRSTFGLPEDSFIFLTSFDGASFLARKNPLATILAFREAFPSAVDSPKVSLVVKAMNTRNDPLWRECLRKSAHDKRIIVLDGVYDRCQYHELLRSCDAVISLHRAEGFGRLMAEAMAIGLPVIASRYSGNLDFMTDCNSWLVGGNLVPVMPGDYPFYDGQSWFEPDISEAALILHQCATDEGARTELAKKGKSDVLSKYHPTVCGEAYLKILQSEPAPAN